MGCSMAIAWTRNVYSAMAQSVGYDPDAQELIVTWKNGQSSAYEGVSEELADRLSRAPSVGRMINQEIKPYFNHRYL